MRTWGVGRRSLQRLVKKEKEKDKKKQKKKKEKYEFEDPGDGPDGPPGGPGGASDGGCNLKKPRQPKKSLRLGVKA